MKNNSDKIDKWMKKFAKNPLVERKNKPQTPLDFEKNLKELSSDNAPLPARSAFCVIHCCLCDTTDAARCKVLQEYQKEVTAALEETRTAVKALPSTSRIAVPLFCERMLTLNIALFDLI